ncbi:snRNA-activating protein complex subunit 4 [Anabrus simplex]|uniref:snRNA-activating protein complex subunit 4 n=1 Tax=Anabrus simplex TaxID=316456 RepID=UPI0035A39AE1
MFPLSEKVIRPLEFVEVPLYEQNNEFVQTVEETSSLHDTLVTDSSEVDNGPSGQNANVPNGEVEVMDELSLLRHCIRQNEAVQELLNKQEITLVYLIEECKKEQLYIANKLENFGEGEESSDVKYVKKLSCCSVFGVPYFKDETLYPSPVNEDYINRQSLGYFDPYDLPRLRLWKDKDKRVVEESIKRFEKGKLLKENKNTQRLLEENISNCSDDKQKQELTDLLVETVQIGECIMNYSLEILVGNRRDEYDWMKISTVDLKGCHTPEECRSIWFNYLHPSVNRKRWTKCEDEKLRKIAKLFGYQEWEKIAKELGTGRSGYQCLCHYQMRLNESMKKCKWTDEESENLCKLVNNFQVGDYIPWAKVTYYMDGRTKNQVYSHWCYVANPDIKKGKFTKEEDIVIVAGARNFGLDFSRIARLLPNRTSIQVRQRFNTLLHAQRCPPPWTSEDDVLILELVSKYGEGHWKEIAEHFPFRTNYQVRFRYGTIKSWFQRNPGCVKPSVNSRKAKTVASIDENVMASVERITKCGRGRGKANGKLNEDLMTVLSSGLLVKLGRKRGRRRGQNRTLTDLDKEFDNFFRCAYSQFGGKAKTSCSSEKIPEMAHRFSHALNILGSQVSLNLPFDTEEIENDKILLPVDKSILMYLAHEKRSLQEDMVLGSSDVPDAATEEIVSTECLKLDLFGSVVENCGKVSRSEYTSRLPYLCPPNFSTIVGLRTFLLSRHSLQKNSKLSAKMIENASLPFACTEDFGNEEAVRAVRLLNERLLSLFTWPALMSNVPPKWVENISECSVSSDSVEHSSSLEMRNSKSGQGMKRRNASGGGFGCGKKRKNK